MNDQDPQAEVITYSYKTNFQTIISQILRSIDGKHYLLPNQLDPIQIIMLPIQVDYQLNFIITFSAVNKTSPQVSTCKDQ